MTPKTRGKASKPNNSEKERNQSKKSVTHGFENNNKSRTNK